jgi:hypothetical protein
VGLCVPDLLGAIMKSFAIELQEDIPLDKTVRCEIRRNGLFVGIFHINKAECYFSVDDNITITEYTKTKRLESLN